MDKMSNSNNTSRRGAQKILSDKDEKNLYQKFLKLPRKAKVEDLAAEFNVSRATLYSVVAKHRDLQSAEDAA